jgi:pyruvate kinase
VVSNEGGSVTTDDSASIRELAEQLEVLRVEMRQRYVDAADALQRVLPSHRLSAANLIDYLTLRHFELREIQESLSQLGLSSLGRAEEHVITTLERVIDNLHVLAGDKHGRRTESAVSFPEGQRILAANSLALLGPNRPGRPARILVTMPTEAATDYGLVADLVARGMDCARINCAHDNPDQWRSMAENVRRAAEAFGRTCRVLMDLPGPKLRTGPIQPGPRVIRLRPKRDQMGRLIAPATAVFHSDDPAQRATSLELEGATFIPVDHEWLTLLHPEDRVTLNDTRDAHRVATVKGVTDTHATVEFADTTYVATGIRLIAPGGRETRVGRLPALEQSIVLHPGDVLTLTQDLSPVDPRELRIGCTLPDALAAARTGQRVLFDDGKIGGLVVDVGCGEIEVSIVSAAPRGTKLRAEKGISLPDTDLDVAALRSEDLLLLPVIAECADLVGLSFAQRADDITALQGHLEAIGGAGLGIVLKVETVRGFNRLPEMLLAAMASERVGVMVARGDLAVECGFERLAEVQEEILWLCEAAHIPTIWATQVLDQLARTGRPSRAEISDAFMAGRAECVMLNKGPHISEAVTALDDILGRMDSYQHKKTALLRRLTSWSQAPT